MHRVRFAPEEIAEIRVLSDRGRGQPWSRIRLKPRRGWRQIYHCQPTKPFEFERELLDHLRARGIKARSSTIILW